MECCRSVRRRAAHRRRDGPWTEVGDCDALEFPSGVFEELVAVSLLRNGNETVWLPVIQEVQIDVCVENCILQTDSSLLFLAEEEDPILHLARRRRNLWICSIQREKPRSSVFPCLLVVMLRVVSARAEQAGMTALLSDGDGTLAMPCCAVLCCAAAVAVCGQTNERASRRCWIRVAEWCLCCHPFLF